MDIQEIINQIASESLEVLKNYLEDSITEVSQEVEIYLQETKVKALRWGTLVAAGSYNKEDIKALLENEKTNLHARLLRIIGEQQIEASNIKDELIDVLMDNLNKLVNE